MTLKILQKVAKKNIYIKKLPMGPYGPKRALLVTLRLKIGRWVLFININLILIRKWLLT